ncbi:hypothetical protein AZE42_09778 [Rhizopogon vesiculosus]|uniref:N-alpha-acetyltransferase 60 n=1 Tax=Rhizopogon vesiculosus TaxID=180088 RepID=A0A1J8QKB7_9AGAM|nr:hypothetical protein AZE42_09778 [Rhizopogon vesiculosus]
MRKVKNGCYRRQAPIFRPLLRLRLPIHLEIQPIMTRYDTGGLSSMPDGVDIRMMRASDVAEVRALHTKLLPVAYPPTFFVQLLVHPQQMCLVATYGSSVVAFSSAVMNSQNWATEQLGSCRGQDGDAGTLQVTLLTLGVSPEFQRRGIARRLVHEVVQRLRSSYRAPCASSHRSESDPTHAVILCAEVARNNTSGQSFYSHLGMHRQPKDDEQRKFGCKVQTCVVLGVMRTVPVS